MKQKPPQSLDECHERVQELEDENQALRQSANAFGQLAERLRDQLELERRTHPDRRSKPRSGPDRRQEQSG